MDAALRLLTKEALKDNNFGQNFFDSGLPAEDKVIAKADLDKTNRMQFKFFARHSEIKARKQVKEAKSLMARFVTSAVEEYDDVMTGTLNLEPMVDHQEDGKGGNAPVPDPDKIFKTYPSFDPVFMKV